MLAQKNNVIQYSSHIKIPLNGEEEDSEHTNKQKTNKKIKKQQTNKLATK